jgi:hypothetical protein
MHSNKWLLVAACTLAITATIAVTWLHAATPTVGPASANPAYIVVNTPTQVTFNVKVTDSTPLPNGINLLKTDAAGKTLSTVGVMHDDGVNGDAKAGDKLFSYALTINQPAVGQVYYRASVAFKGVLQRLLSNVINVTVDPFKLPPDPGEAGNQTLEGIDSDGDGVRDDVQRYIAWTYPNIEQENALSQYARALQKGIGTSPSDDSPNQKDTAIRCLIHVFGPSEAERQSALLLSKTANTIERLRAWRNGPSDNRSTLGPIRESGLASHCVTQ